MLSRGDVLKWQDKFSVGLPFRKLLKVMQSLPLNIWMAQLHANGLVKPDMRSVRDLALCDMDELWREANKDWSLRTSNHFLARSSYARIVPSLAAFRSQAKKCIDSLSTDQKLQDIWNRYGAILQHGFGLRSAGENLASDTMSSTR